MALSCGLPLTLTTRPDTKHISRIIHPQRPILILLFEEDDKGRKGVGGKVGPRAKGGLEGGVDDVWGGG